MSTKARDLNQRFLSTGTGTLILQALECVAWISKQQAMSKKLLASAFQNFKQFGNRLARPVSMVYNGETNGRRMTLCPQEICCVDLTILRSAAWRSVCTYRIC